MFHISYSFKTQAQEDNKRISIMISYRGFTFVKVSPTSDVNVISCNERCVYIGSLSDEHYELSQDGCTIKFYQYFAINTSEGFVLNDIPMTYSSLIDLINHFL